jgi:ATP-dependent Clp protease ATP-binding subunit ClpC
MAADGKGMFDNFTEHARRALYYSRYEAGRRNSSHVEPEHILLGLLRDGSEEILKLLAHFDLKPEDLSRPFETSQLTAGISGNTPMPLSEQSKQVLARAGAEAESLGGSGVAVTHLLLGILSVETSSAAKLLAEKGINGVGLRREVQRLPQG